MDSVIENDAEVMYPVLPMIELPLIELKEDRQELIVFF